MVAPHPVTGPIPGQSTFQGCDLKGNLYPPVTIYFPRQLIKTRWVRIDWERTPNVSNKDFSIRFSFSRELGNAFYLKLHRLDIRWKVIAKDKWVKDGRWFWRPLS